MKRVALVGLGGYGQMYVGLLSEMQRAGQLQATAAVSIDPVADAEAREKLAALGTRFYDSYPALMAAEAERLDLVCLPVPIALHVPFAITALRAGLNVLVEKPLAGSLAEIDALQEVERATGRWAAVGFHHVYSRPWHALKARLLADFGPLQSLTVVTHWPRPDRYYQRNGWAGRLHVKGQPVFDSPANNAAAHYLHLALWLAGDSLAATASPSRVEADLARANPIESFDTCGLRLQVGGATLLFLVSHATALEDGPHLVARYAQGTFRWSMRHAPQLFDAQGQLLETVTDISEGERRRHMLEAVLAKLDDPSHWVCDTASARAHAEVIAAAHAQTAISEVPSRFRYDRQTDKGTFRTIWGMGPLLAEAERRLALPREVGAPWAL